MGSPKDDEAVADFDALMASEGEAAPEEDEAVADFAKLVDEPEPGPEPESAPPSGPPGSNTDASKTGTSNVSTTGAGDTSWADYALAVSKGLGQNMFARAGQELAEMAMPLPEGTERVGGGALDQIPDTALTKLAQGAGHLATGIPATVLGGASIPGQAIAGGTLAAFNAKGTGADPAGVATAAGSGAALSGLGGGFGKAAEMLSAVPGAGTLVPKGVELAKKLAPKFDDYTDLSKLVMVPGRLAAQAAVTGMTKAPGAAKAIGQAVTPLASPVAGPIAGVVGDKVSQTASALMGGTAQGQDKAYAGTPTTSWAVQSVLSSGSHGLPPDAEQQLTEAVMSGDPTKVVSTNFVLSQRFPAYEKRLRDEYESLQRGEGQ